jgi:hypothetical protein
VIGAEFHGPLGGAAFRNVAGSFYDFEAVRFRGTREEKLSSPPDAWGGRAAVDWVHRLAAGERFDMEAMQFVKQAAVIDRIYGRET